MHRLSFEIKTETSELNRVLEQILREFTKNLNYLDDIIVHGRTEEECRRNLELCFERLKTYDIHSNRSMCFFFQKNVEYLGHRIASNKISKKS